MISGVDDSTVNFWETYFINFYDSMNPDKGYNLRSGGKKWFNVSEETRQKLSLVSKGRIMSDEHKQKISQSNKGRIMSDEHKQKLSQSHKGQIPWNKGKKRSEETRQKLSLTFKGKHWKLVDGKRVWY